MRHLLELKNRNNMWVVLECDHFYGLKHSLYDIIILRNGRAKPFDIRTMVSTWFAKVIEGDFR